MTHWHDTTTEKPEDGEMVLIYGRERFSYMPMYEVVKYEKKYETEPTRGFGKFVPYSDRATIEKWMRIPPIE